jgi:hypothetical protein
VSILFKEEDDDGVYSRTRRGGRGGGLVFY